MSSYKIAVIDYDAGNIRSVEKAMAYLGQKVKITRDHEELMHADKVILPGVGSFGDAMNKLKEYDLIDTIYRITENNTPFFGICLGLQLLFESSEETLNNEKGLCLLEGQIKKIPPLDHLKVPQIGWNSLDFPNQGRLFDGIKEGAYVYFVHSFYLEAKDPAIVTATTQYGTLIDASIEKDNIFGCQFHPEKSSSVGLKILKNFIDL